METKEKLLLFVQKRLDSGLCKHLYLRGNLQIDMFFDKVDFINCWNRFWLSAAATDVKILSLEILNNHFHATAILEDEKHCSEFKHHFRLSLTQYHNRRYELKGMVGMRRLEKGTLEDMEDLMDCICYNLRNVVHHGISQDYLGYKYSTVLNVFGLNELLDADCYTRMTLPDNLGRAYLPARVDLPNGWLMTREGMIVPPPEVFRAEILEALFSSRDEYLETLTHITRREEANQDQPFVQTRLKSRSVRTLDEEVSEFVQENCQVPIASMSEAQKMKAVFIVKEAYPNVSLRTLQRLFGIPATTLQYRLTHWHMED